MNYQQTLDWMFAQLPMYQRQGATAFKKDLTNIVAFSEKLDFPQKKFESIHIGGTNGKGSTAHMVASILQEAGYKTGLYTSPHLKNFTERIRINGREISRKFVVDFIAEHQQFLEKQRLSFFEMTVGMAFDYFAKEMVDIAIVEVGLGGRLDSTNILLPLVSVITNIGYDHTQFLGTTLTEIASEKAGIIKEKIPVIIGERQEEVEHVFIGKAKQMNSKIIFASDIDVDYSTDLKGKYQQNNLKTAVVTVQSLKKFIINISQIKEGLVRVVENTGIRGRWDVLEGRPKIICDTAHNKEGLNYVMEQLLQEKFEKLHIVLGMVRDKELDEVLELFPKDADYYFCRPDIPRGLHEKELQERSKEYHLFGSSFPSVNLAYKASRDKASESDLIYIGGSTFVVAEIL